MSTIVSNAQGLETGRRAPVVTMGMEARVFWAVHQAYLAAIRCGDIETARIAREELKVFATMSDFPAIRAAAARALAL